MTQTPAIIPVLRPKLPDADALLPYLRQIDTNRWYSNFGPLVLAFELALAKRANIGVENLTTVTNGTLALTLALQTFKIPAGALCLMPSWTFTATPAAAQMAGLTPYFMDVDAHTQALDPEYVRAQLPSIKGAVGAIIVVAPFGAPVDTLAWDRFSDETGIPVIIDAAAAFDAVISGLMPIGQSPIMVSLHATKALGIGEGALLLSRNEEWIATARMMSNFGFDLSRKSQERCMNAKISEYAAAVGLAALDSWDARRAAWARVRDYYTQHLHGMELWLDKNWVSSTCNVITSFNASDLVEALAANGIETRRWWSGGCHTHPAYKALPCHEELVNTKRFGQSTLGLPCSIDMSTADLARICETLLQHAAIQQPHKMTA
jgi:dTDP-4-amino-4,6-dideoxygalactose transaminase